MWYLFSVYMFVCRLVISVQGVIIIDLSSLGCIVPEMLKSIKKKDVAAKFGVPKNT